jgi:GNAT superfamily N-acetyltransferase
MNTGGSSFGELQITNSTQMDLDIIFRLFDGAIAYQQRNHYELWPRFSEELIMNEMDEKRHWKIVGGETIACIFSVLYNDPVIWGEKNKDGAVYLHRIAVNPAFKGKGIMKLIRHWAIEHARQKGLQYVRMDTWGNNENLRAYYINCGFNYIGQQHLKEADGLPGHYGGSILSLFQIEVTDQFPL